MRTAEIKRKTNETDIELKLCLDGKGTSDVNTGSAFLDHMLTLFAKHGKFDLTVKCQGDTEVDFHHTAEDVGICLGTAVKEALGNKAGITRYADTTLPMDEALILCAVDISGRSYLNFDAPIPSPKIGDFDSELVEEFMFGFVRKAGITLHISKLYGSNSHHIAEGIFKALAKVMGKATEIDEKYKDEIPSTKGVL